jgi:2,6-dihydroxypseudooxynicotine hydrolase
VVVGAEDKLVPPSEGERLAKTASGPAEVVVYPEGNHVCFNISYKYRPLTADWMAEHLRVRVPVFAIDGGGKLPRAVPT